MELKQSEVKLEDCLTVGEYLKVLKSRTGNEKLVAGTIHYHTSEKDSLDWVWFCGMKLIVQNEKAASFNPGTYYGHTRTRTDSFKK